MSERLQRLYFLKLISTDLSSFGLNSSISIINEYFASKNGLKVNYKEKLPTVLKIRTEQKKEQREKKSKRKSSDLKSKSSKKCLEKSKALKPTLKDFHQI